MHRNPQRGWRIFGAALALSLLLVGPAQAALINLQAYVLYGLMNSDGTLPLADGSLVQIIGSYDDIANPMQAAGDGVTGQPTGDDLIIANITIQSGILGIDGTFYSGDYYFESDEVKYMYLRFYDTAGPLTGMVYWGQSPVTNAEHHQFGGIFMDFIGGYSTTNQDNFVVIPEPGTLNLLMVWLSMVAAMRASMKRDQQKTIPVRKGRIPTPRTENFTWYEHF